MVDGGSAFTLQNIFFSPQSLFDWLQQIVRQVRKGQKIEEALRGPQQNSVLDRLSALLSLIAVFSVREWLLEPLEASSPRGEGTRPSGFMRTVIFGSYPYRGSWINKIRLSVVKRETTL